MWGLWLVVGLTAWFSVGFSTWHVHQQLFCCMMMPWPAHKIEKLNDGGQSSFLIEEKVFLVHLHNYFVGVNRGDRSFFVLW